MKYCYIEYDPRYVFIYIHNRTGDHITKRFIVNMPLELSLLISQDYPKHESYYKDYAYFDLDYYYNYRDINLEFVSIDQKLYIEVPWDPDYSIIYMYMWINNHLSGSYCINPQHSDLSVNVIWTEKNYG